MLRLTRIPQTVRNLNRFREIAQVFIKHGFGDIFTRLGLDPVLHTLTAPFRRSPPLEISSEVRIRKIFEELGATFIKLGQVLATRPDVIPMSLIKELRSLQDDVAPVPSDKVLTMLEEEFGCHPDQIFADFSNEALAAASIGQVHRATLKSGEEVVLKVQRPGLGKMIETDLNILAWLAELMVENMPETRRYDPIGMVRQFERSILKEIDFEREAMHIKRFARNFEGDEGVYVPKVHDQWTTSKVLCEEFIRGLKCDSKEITGQSLEHRERVALNGISCILQQVFVHGFFHADPHPGNIFVVDGDKVCFIDYGMMGNLDDERIDEMLSFLVSILTRDAEGIVRLFAKLDLIEESVNERLLRADLMDLLERYGTIELSKIDIGRIITDIFDVIVRHDITIPSDLLLVGKALATIDGVAREIYPELEPLETIRPKILEIYLTRLSDPRRMMRGPRRILEQNYDLLQSFAKDFRLILRKWREGQAQSNFRIVELSLILKEHNRTQNRLFLAIIIGALCVSSALLLRGSDIYLSFLFMRLEIALGLFFFGLSVVYGAVLVIGFFRSGGV